MDQRKTPTKAEGPTIVLPENPDQNHIMVQKSKLLVISGALQGKEFVVDKDVFTIGAGPDNDLALEDTTVSQRHSEIQIVPEGHRIRDLGSTNGTIVQGVKVSEAYLEQGTEFQLGQTRIIFCPLQESMEYTLSSKESFGAMLGKSIGMRRVFHLAEMYAPTDATVLIQGETGTGKEILAEEMHRHSKRADKPFIVIDCGALAKELIESELFGHTKGAFTSANNDRVGAFEHAQGGTVFLDEIGDLSTDLQPKLLRVLEKKEIRRLGSNEVKHIDVRIMSATNRKLIGEVRAGRFREDLFFRLSVVHIELPPLARRKEDLPLLSREFLRAYHGDEALEQVADFDKAMEVFNNHNWPGNVRELRNLIEIAFYNQRRPVDLTAFLYLGRASVQPAAAKADHAADRPFKDAKGDLISDFEQAYVRDILRRHDGNISKAAREAGIERAYLQRLIRKYALK